MQYQIGDFSIIARISIKTLRYYHEYGLLEPALIDAETGYRYYDESCLERARKIKALKELDFPLKEIKEILDNCEDDSELISYAVKKSGEIKERIARYSRMHKKLADFIRRTEQVPEVKTRFNAEIVIKDIPDARIVSTRFKGRYQELTPAFDSLFANYDRYCTGAPFALYYDNEYKEDEADIEACIPVGTSIEIDGFKCRELAGGKAVSVIHMGPYETLGQSYKTILDYINKTRRRIRLPHREIYLKGPGMLLPRSSQKFVIEIQMLFL